MKCTSGKCWSQIFKVKLFHVLHKFASHAELLEFQTLRDLEQHTDASLLAVDNARKR